MPRRHIDRRSTPRAAAIAALAIVALACAARVEPQQDASAPRVGTSDLENVPPPETEPEPEAKRRPFEIPAEIISQELPVYPQEAVSMEVACVARILYHIETTGSATLIRLEWEAPPPDQHREAFETSIEEALSRWEFKPAMKIRGKKLPDGSTVADQRLIPKASYAIIRFRVEDGRGIVE